MAENIIVDELFVRKAILSDATCGLITPNFRLVYFSDANKRRSINSILEKENSNDRENIDIIAEDYFFDLGVFFQDRRLDSSHLYPCETNIVIDEGEIICGFAISYNFVYRRQEDTIRVDPNLP